MTLEAFSVDMEIQNQLERAERQVARRGREKHRNNKDQTECIYLDLCR